MPKKDTDEKKEAELKADIARVNKMVDGVLDGLFSPFAEGKYLEEPLKVAFVEKMDALEAVYERDRFPKNKYHTMETLNRNNEKGKKAVVETVAHKSSKKLGKKPKMSEPSLEEQIATLTMATPEPPAAKASAKAAVEAEAKDEKKTRLGFVVLIPKAVRRSIEFIFKRIVDEVVYVVGKNNLKDVKVENYAEEFEQKIIVAAEAEKAKLEEENPDKVVIEMSMFKMIKFATEQMRDSDNELIESSERIRKAISDKCSEVKELTTASKKFVSTLLTKFFKTMVIDLSNRFYHSNKQSMDVGILVSFVSRYCEEYEDKSNLKSIVDEIYDFPLRVLSKKELKKLQDKMKKAEKDGKAPKKALPKMVTKATQEPPKKENGDVDEAEGKAGDEGKAEEAKAEEAEAEGKAEEAEAEEAEEDAAESDAEEAESEEEEEEEEKPKPKPKKAPAKAPAKAPEPAPAAKKPPVKSSAVKTKAKK